MLLLRVRGGDVVIGVGGPAGDKAQKALANKRPAHSAARPLMPTLLWALGSISAVIYMVAILCLCAYPIVRFMVLLALHVNKVGSTHTP